MKKTLLLSLVMLAFGALQAQWVNDPANNTFLSNTSADAGEIYLSTSPNGDIYVQWSQFGPNSWSPTLQRINVNGEPQWDNSGIHPSYHQMASWSQGFAMAATSDNAVVTCFSNKAGHTIAIKINADGTYAWGEQGLTLFEGHGNSRTELLAGDDGGVWALGTDINLGNTYLCYIEANGTTNPTITISDSSGKLCMFALLVPTDNGVFVVYEKESWAYTYYYEKEIWVEGYNKNGEAISTPERLMAAQTIGSSYRHYVVPDGLGGGYAYIWHPAIGDSFNTYVFHFNQNGATTIMNPNGIPVHVGDPNYMFLDACATVDPLNHDLLIAYIQTDSQFQAQCQLFVNRITMTGETPWGDGKLFLDNGTTPCTDLRIDAFEYGEGFSVMYNKDVDGTGYNTGIEAKGFDMGGNEIWITNMSSQGYPRAMCEYTTGFINGQNVVAWVNSSTGGLYGQNIDQNGEMGEITPPIPPDPCNPPTNFHGEYYAGTVMSGPMLSWDAPDPLPLHYHLYREGLREVIELDPEITSYIEEVDPGEYIYRLTAVYESCESIYALTESGDDYVLIEVPDHTMVSENADSPIVTILTIYTLNGQALKATSTENLSNGIYVIQGLTQDGKLVTRKTVVTSKL